MFITPEGKIAFNTVAERDYNLFMVIGLGINQNQYLYDQDNGTQLNYKGKYIKATITETPVYAGRNDVVFDPSRNYALMATLLGYYIDKESNSEDGDRIGFISQGNEDSRDKKYHRMFIQTSKKGRIESDWYECGYLGFLDCIFKLDGQNIDLHNFDIWEERK
jgi:hypothetical protein